MASVTTLAVLGDTETAIGDSTVTVAEADLVASACAVAVTVIVGGVGTVAGAVYRPVPSIAPHADPVQPAPERLQLTPKAFDPVTVAVNCCCAPVFSCLLVGEIEISMAVINVTWADADLLESA